MFKRTYLSLLVSALLPLSAMSATVDMPASGKTEDIAVKKAGLSAVRAAMIEIKGEKFLQEHTKEIRNKVILKIDDFVTGTQVVSLEQNEKGMVQIYARVDYDRDKLTSVLNEIGGDSGVQTAANAENAGVTAAANVENTDAAKDAPLVTEAEMAYLGGVNPAEITTVEGTKLYYHALRNKLLSDVQNQLTAMQSDIRIKSLGDEPVSDTSDIFRYTAFDEDKEFYTASFTNTYDVGTVDSALSVNDAFFKNLDIVDAAVPFFKELLNTSKHRFNIRDDTTESVFTTGRGETGTFKWDPVEISLKSFNVSKTFGEFEANMKVPGMSLAERKMNLADLTAFFENRPQQMILNIALKKLNAAENDDSSYVLDNYVQNFGILPSENKKPANFDMSYKIGFDKYVFMESGKGFELNGTQLKFGIKHIDFSYGAGKCGIADPGKFTFPALFNCMIRDNDDEDYIFFNDNPVVASFRQSGEIGYDLSLAVSEAKLGREMDIDIFDIRGLKLGIESSENRFGMKTQIDGLDVVQKDISNLAVTGFKYDYGFISNASGRRNNIDLFLNASLDNFKLIEDGDYDIKGTSLEFGLKNVSTAEFSKFCKLPENDHLSLISSVRCLADSDSDDWFSPGASLVQKDTGAYLNFKTTLNGAPVSLNSVLSVDPAYDDSGKDSMSVVPYITVTADLKVDKSVFFMKQYGLEDALEFSQNYIADPEAGEYVYHIVFKNGTVTINGKALSEENEPENGSGNVNENQD